MRLPVFPAVIAFAIATPLLADSPPPAPASSPPAEEIPDLRTRKSGNDWPGFLGPTADSKSTEKIRTRWPQEGLEIRWFHKVGEGYSMPSTSQGRLFMFDRVGEEARLIALRSETGEELWRSTYKTNYEDYYDYSVGPRAVPVIDEGRVYTFGVEGRLRAHRVRDGALLWEIDTERRYGVVKNFFGVGSTPVIEEDLLIVHIGGSPPESPKIHTGEVKGNGSGIVAFDKRTGEERYRITDELASYATPVLTTIAGRRWGFMFSRGGLVGFEPRRGEVDFFYPWRSKILESVNAASPVVVGDTVFITETYGPGSSLLKVRPGGYELLWKDPRRGKSMEAHWSTPIYHEGYLYGSSGRSAGNAELRAIEHKTGKVAWSEPGLHRSTLLYADGHFVVLTEYGRLLLIEATPERFSKVAEMDLSDPSPGSDPKKPIDRKAETRPVLRHPAWNAPVLSHGLLYVRGKDQLICLDIAPASGTTG